MSFSENLHTQEDLKTMQNWKLGRKIQVTQYRILEWYTKWEGNVFVSFSGGKDSTVLLDLVRRMFPEVPAVFVDTGLEYPEIRDFVKTIDNVEILKPEMNFKEVITTYGYPLVSKQVAKKIEDYRRKPDGYTKKLFDEDEEYVKEHGVKYCVSKWKFLRDSNIPVSNKCCNVMKKEPFKRYEKMTGRKPIIGTMAEESISRRDAWLKNGCNNFNSSQPKSQPMSFWTNQDVLEYIKIFKIPYSSAYGDILLSKKGQWYTTKCDRTGCMFCGFGAHLEKEPNRFQKLKETHPYTYNWIMKPLEDGGLGMKEVLEYINVKVD